MMHNAECDSMQPKSSAQLRAELKARERAWSKKQTVVEFGRTDDDFEEAAALYSMEISSDDDCVGKQNRESFGDLVRNLRERTDRK
jgi:hypothetical protein